MRVRKPARKDEASNLYLGHENRRGNDLLARSFPARLCRNRTSSTVYIKEEKNGKHSSSGKDESRRTRCGGISRRGQDDSSRIGTSPGKQAALEAACQVHVTWP